ncbi:MAG: type II toxin-antitoxin system RelE/ParE family toxin [Dongiaceae bacterium]
MTYVFHPEAEAEHLEAVAFYEDRRPGIGAAYLAEFERALARVCEAPDRYPIKRQPDIRGIRLRRFPFEVLYREVGGRVEILAVAHHRRRPAYWVGRL